MNSDKMMVLRKIGVGQLYLRVSFFCTKKPLHNVKRESEKTVIC